MSLKNSNKCSLCDSKVVEDLCHFLLLCPALEKIRRPLLNDISFNTVELYIWQYIKSHHIHKNKKIYIMYKTCLKVKYR
jgi:hypothetical protein